MDKFEELCSQAEEENIEIIEKRFASQAKGLCKGNKIGISKDLETTAQKACVLAEELGHYHTTVGDILDLKEAGNRKQEKTARNWAYAHLLPLEKLVEGCRLGCRNLYELAEYLEVTETFLADALTYYESKYGLCVECDGLLFYFRPFGFFQKLR